MKFLKLVLFSAALTFSLVSHGSEALTQQFRGEFYNQYRAGKCGQNVMELAERAAANGINISNARVLQIRNVGFSVFGLVRAEFARGSGPLANSPQPHGIRWYPGGTNWQFHAVLELDGLIYDFDFGNEPKVLRVAEYFEQMFLNEKENNPRAMFYVGRDEKLSKYEVTVVSAVDLVSRRSSPSEEVMSLGKYLSRF